jgi:protease stability complex PrcB-like protein
MWFLAFALAAQTMTPPLRVVDKGGQSGIGEPRQVVVRTADEWTKLWRVHGMDRALPKVDFTKETIVGVFMGSRPTAGFVIEIVGIADAHGARVVRYKETMPSREAITAQILTSPFELVAIPKVPGDVRFEKVQ